MYSLGSNRLNTCLCYIPFRLHRASLARVFSTPHLQTKFSSLQSLCDFLWPHLQHTSLLSAARVLTGEPRNNRLLNSEIILNDPVIWWNGSSLQMIPFRVEKEFFCGAQTLLYTCNTLVTMLQVRGALHKQKAAPPARCVYRAPGYYTDPLHFFFS